jgi:hypothetical protein
MFLSKKNKRQTGSARNKNRKPRLLTMEGLETRNLMSASPLSLENYVIPKANQPQLPVEAVEVRAQIASNATTVAKPIPAKLQQVKAIVPVFIQETKPAPVMVQKTAPTTNVENSVGPVKAMQLAGKAEHLENRVDQLKQRLDGITITPVANVQKAELGDGVTSASAGRKASEAARDRFFESAFGTNNVSDGSRTVGSVLDQIEGMSGSRSRNPLDNQGSGLIFSRNGMLSDGDADGQECEKMQEKLGKAAEEFGEVTGALVTIGAGAALVIFGVSPPGWVVGALAGAGAASGAFVLGGKGAQATADTNDCPKDGKGGEPVEHDVPRSDSRIVTQEQVNGLMARFGGKSEPVDNGSGGSGGPVAVPKTTQQGEWVEGSSNRASAVTRIQLKGIEAKLNGNITLINS